LYTKSWVGLYFGYEGTANSDNVVVFNNPIDGSYVTDDRFKVLVMLTEQTKLYFSPPLTWETLTPDADGFYNVELLSQVKHGMPSHGYPYTKSVFYTSPYFITFKTNHAVESNYLRFNDFLVPNSYGRILGLLYYDDNFDRFMPGFLADIRLPYTNSLSLTSILEFEIVDSNQKRVEFADQSQLYIQLEVL
jgi:hypothetical protein